MENLVAISISVNILIPASFFMLAESLSASIYVKFLLKELIYQTNHWRFVENEQAKFPLGAETTVLVDPVSIPSLRLGP